MKTLLRRLVPAALGFAVFVTASPVHAQDPYADYNRERAYRQFLNSPYSFRTYSDLQAGRSWRYATPFEFGEVRQTPGYYHEEIGPYGRWSTGVPSRAERFVTPRAPLLYPPVYAPTLVPAEPYPAPYPP